MTTRLLRVLLSFVLSSTGILQPVFGQSAQQCVFETTADGVLSAATVRKVSGPTGCDFTTASGTDFYLYVIHDVVLSGNLIVGGTSNGTSGKLIIGRRADGLADPGSLTEPSGQNYTLTVRSNQQSDIGLDVAPGGLLSVNNLVINKVDGVIQTNGVVNTECNVQLTNNTDLVISGRLNVLGNLDLTGSTGSTKISGNGLSAGNGLRVQGNIYGNNSTSVNSYFSTDGSGNPTLTVCVQGLAISCPVPNGVVATGASNDPSCVSRVLPVALTRFYATWRPNGRALALNWQTASEKNNAVFQLERSVDGIIFETLLTVPGAGNSTSLRSYTALDERPLRKLGYYRLRQLDFDGSSTTSAIIAVAPLLENSADWLVHTATPRQYQVLTPQGTAGQLQVVDALGRTVHQQAVGPDNALVTLPLLSAGVYLYRLSTPAGQLSQRLLQP